MTDKVKLVLFFWSPTRSKVPVVQTNNDAMRLEKVTNSICAFMLFSTTLKSQNSNCNSALIVCLHHVNTLLNIYLLPTSEQILFLVLVQGSSLHGKLR